MLLLFLVVVVVVVLIVAVAVVIFRLKEFHYYVGWFNCRKDASSHPCMVQHSNTKHIQNWVSYAPVN